MKLPTLYARTSTGAIQEWTVEIKDNCYRTMYGQLGGIIQATEWTSCGVMNEGRANERSPEEQAYAEASAMWQKKKDTGYHEEIADIDKQVYVEPMLAKKWEDRKDKVKFPVYCQRKMDGLRCVITKDGAKSRNGKPWLTIPHILKELEPLFAAHPDVILDGELYNHELHDDFNKITSLAKKTKPTVQDLKESEKVIQFWWYDICDSVQDFSTRIFTMIEMYSLYKFDDNKYIMPVETYLCNNSEELDSYYELFLEKGYEGQMIRLDRPYEFKRSANLLKRKEFQDDEFQILDIIEGLGNRSGGAGAMVFKTKEGKSFNSNIKGTREYMAELLAKKDEYIGQLATVVYFNLTPDGIPRFPFVHSIRGYDIN